MPRTPISTPDAPAAIGPYSQAVRAGGTVYFSGQIPLDPATGELVAGDITAQARRAFDNLKAVAEAAGTLKIEDDADGKRLVITRDDGEEDLVATDQAAMSCIDPDRRGQDRDNYIWIRDAESNDLVVGTQARILYQDAKGRVAIALRTTTSAERRSTHPCAGECGRRWSRAHHRAA